MKAIMTSQRLTKRIVDAAEKSIKDTYVWDTELKGFGLKVTPKGRKVYIAQYRIGKRTRRITIGTHGALSTEDARKQARIVLGKVLAGEDPAGERDKAKLDFSIEELFAKFDETYISMHVKPETAKDYRRVFAKYVFPRFKHITVRNISKQDMLRLHHDMRMSPYRANRTIANLSKFFNWCEQYGYREEYSNPTRHVKKYKEHARQRYLSNEEQEKLGQALNKAEAENIACSYSVNAIRLLSLTGARLREITTLKWEYINFESGIINLPDSKTGAKIIYLNDAAKDVLSRIIRQVDNPYVICGNTPGKSLVNLQKPWTRIRDLAGLQDVRMHDLRHTFASVAAMGGMSLPMIGALLGHSQAQTTARYAHLAADPIKAANEKVGRIIGKAVI